MKIHDAHSHLTSERGANVRSWSREQTRRRLSTLVALARPYRVRVALGIVTLLLATATALAPPYLAKLAIDAAAAEAIACAVRDIDPSLALVGLAGSLLPAAGRAAGATTA